MESTFDELVPFFNQHCGHDDNAVVAVLGSAFVMPQPQPNSTYFDHHIQNVFSKYFGLKLGDKFMKLLKCLYEEFPNHDDGDGDNYDDGDDHTSAVAAAAAAAAAAANHGYYSAVHVRFQDGMKVQNCNATSVRQLYLDLFPRLEERNVPHGTHILVADSNPAAFRCFQYHAAAAGTESAAGSAAVRYKGFRIKDYIHLGNGNHHNSHNNNYNNINELFKNINVQKDTLYLLLDQIMVGLGKEIVFSFHGTTTMRSSTFQGQIQRWHENRKSIIAAMEAMDGME